MRPDHSMAAPDFIAESYQAIRVSAQTAAWQWHPVDQARLLQSASMTTRSCAVSFGPSTTGLETARETRIVYIKQSSLIIWPVGIASWNRSHGGGNSRTRWHVYTGGQRRRRVGRDRNFAPKCAADGAIDSLIQFGANIIQVDQKVLVLPAMCRSSMAHGATIGVI